MAADAVDVFFGDTPAKEAARAKAAQVTAYVSPPALKDPQVYVPTGQTFPELNPADLCTSCKLWCGQWYQGERGENLCMECAVRLLPEGRKPQVGDKTFMMRRREMARACSASLLLPMAEWVTKSRKFNENKDDSV